MRDSQVFLSLPWTIVMTAIPAAAPIQARKSFATAEDVLIQMLDPNMGLSILDKDTIVVMRQANKGRNQPKALTTVYLTNAVRMRAIELYRASSAQFGACSDELKTKLDEYLEKFKAISLANRANKRRPEIFQDNFELPVFWRSSKPKNPDEGRWSAFISVPLNLYQEKLGLALPVKMPGKTKESYRTMNELKVSFRKGEIIINTKEAINSADKLLMNNDDADDDAESQG